MFLEMALLPSDFLRHSLIKILGPVELRVIIHPFNRMSLLFIPLPNG
jgi:hypothetical protein